MDKAASESYQANRKVKNTMVTPLYSICPPQMNHLGVNIAVEE